MANRTGKGTFKKGDPRINRLGRPASFTEFRDLAQAIAHEKALVKNKDTGAQEALVVDGHSVTIAEAILRQWAMSKNPVLQKAFIEYFVGKVPEQHQVTGEDGGPVVIHVVYDDKKDA